MAMIKVNGVTIKTPSEFTWGLQDVSADSAGRTQDALMHKDRIAQKITLNLSWNGLTFAETSTIIQAFNPEYVNVTYPDPLAGNAATTKKFYVGDRSAPFKIWTTPYKVIEKLSFNLIER